MDIIVMRHCEPDYILNCSIENSSALKSVGLSENGRRSAEYVSVILQKKRIDAILTSPLKRSYETACIVGKTLNREIIIENDLREWEIEYSLHTTNRDLFHALFSEFIKYKGKRNANCLYEWEDIDVLGQRLFNVLEKYKKDNKRYLIVGHKMLFGQLIDTRNMQYGEFYEVHLQQPYWNGFVEAYANNNTRRNGC